MRRALPTIAFCLLTLGLVGCQSAFFATLNIGKGARPDIERYGEHPSQVLDVYRAERGDAAPVVVFFYGGRWQAGKRSDYAFVGRALAARGVTALIVDYRYYPEVRFPTFVDDAALAIAWAHEHAAQIGGDAERVYVAGHSAGAHIAALIGTDARYLRAVGMAPRDLAGVIGIAGPYDFLPLTEDDLKDIFGPEARWPESQPVNFVDGDEPPFLLLHGSDDSWSGAQQVSLDAKCVLRRPVDYRCIRLGHIRILSAFRPIRTRGDARGTLRFIDERRRAADVCAESIAPQCSPKPTARCFARAPQHVDAFFVLRHCARTAFEFRHALMVATAQLGGFLLAAHADGIDRRQVLLPHLRRLREHGVEVLAQPGTGHSAGFRHFQLRQEDCNELAGFDRRIEHQWARFRSQCRRRCGSQRRQQLHAQRGFVGRSELRQQRIELLLAAKARRHLERDRPLVAGDRIEGELAVAAQSEHARRAQRARCAAPITPCSRAAPPDPAQKLRSSLSSARASSPSSPGADHRPPRSNAAVPGAACHPPRLSRSHSSVAIGAVTTSRALLSTIRGTAARNRAASSEPLRNAALRRNRIGTLFALVEAIKRRIERGWSRASRRSDSSRRHRVRMHPRRHTVASMRIWLLAPSITLHCLCMTSPIA